MIVVAFYTIDTPYEEEVRQLEASCKEHGLTLYAKGYKQRSSWVENAGIKPEFLLATMQERKCDLLYVDADARIRQSLDLSFVTGDIGVHYRHGRELLSGTIFLRYTECTMLMLREWVCMQQAYPREWDQRVLQKVITRLQKSNMITVTDLPPAYTQIFDTMAHHGEPIIEHFQASRRYKKEVSMPVSIPARLGRVRIRTSEDGTVTIPRADRIAEAFLDEHMLRCRNELMWKPKFVEGTRSLSVLEPVFAGNRCYIVGKGPSLDKIKEKDFPDPRAPVIALNEAVLVIEQLDIPNPIFGLQQDARLKDTCYPEHAELLVSQKAIQFYDGKERVYAFSSLTYGLSINSLSVLAAMEIAKSFKTLGFYFVCFDAATSGKLEYAKSVPYSPAEVGDPKRFKGHKARMMHAARGLTVGWVTPR
jgi:Nucleotide-diphospho-sugar transferase